MNNFDTHYTGGMGPTVWFHPYGPLLAILLIWTIFWKGLALWHSGRHNQGWWFVVMLIVNTVGILEIIYLFAICKLKFSELFGKK
jgi:hypothetical protein